MINESSHIEPIDTSLRLRATDKPTLEAVHSHVVDETDEIVASSPNTAMRPFIPRHRFGLRGLLWFVTIIAVVLALITGGLMDRIRQVMNPVEWWGIEVVSVERKAWPAPNNKQLTFDFTFRLRLAAEREFDFYVEHRRYDATNDGIQRSGPISQVTQRSNEIGRCHSHRQYLGHSNIAAVRFVGNDHQLIMYDVAAGIRKIGQLSLQPPANAFSCSVTEPPDNRLIFASGNGNHLLRVVWNIKSNERTADLRIVDEFLFYGVFTPMSAAD